jgi:hypothetical protein
MRWILTHADGIASQALWICTSASPTSVDLGKTDLLIQ